MSLPEKGKRSLMPAIYLLIAALIVVGDQMLKAFVVKNLEMGGQMKLLPGVIHLTLVHNYGAAFSILQDMRLIFVAVTVIAAVLIIWAVVKRKFKGWGLLSISFILGGAVGNAVDRTVLGYVVDMFEVEFMEYAVFNLADCFIVVGAILFIIYYLFFDSKYKAAVKADGKEKDAPERKSETKDE